MPGTTPNFDRIARPYRLLEALTLGTALSRTRNQFLPALTTARHALLLGDGDGRFLERLLRANPHLQATAVDASHAMLHLLRGRCGFAGNRLQTYAADALTCAAATASRGPFDLVVTHFFLDCFTEPQLALLIPAVRAQLQPGALWVVSDFRVPPGLLRFPARVFIRGLYLAFRLLTGLRPVRLPDFGASLRRAGLLRAAVHYRLGGMLTAELWSLPAQATVADSR